MCPCPAYADLLWYADHGEAARPLDHLPDQCPCCQERLAEYREMRDALKALTGIETYSPETLNAAFQSEADGEPHCDTIVETDASVNNIMAFIRNAGMEAPGTAQAKSLLEQARTWYFRDWPRAEALAIASLTAAHACAESENRMARTLAFALIANATSALGYCLIQQGKLEDGLAQLLAAHECWEALGDPLGIGKNQNNLAIAYMYKKQLVVAEGYAREGIRNLGSIDQVLEVAEGRQILAIILGDLGNPEAALGEALRAAAAFRDLDQPLRLGLTLHSAATHLFALGRHAEAAGTLGKARQLIADGGDRMSVARCDWLMGKIQCADAASFSAGISTLQRAKSALLAHDNWLETACLLCDLAAFELAAGQRAAAGKTFSELRAHLPADQQNSWVSEAVAELRGLFERAADDAIMQALAAFNQRLGANETMLPADGTETRH